MTQKNTALVDQSAIDEARALSGEANNVKFDFTPIIEIDNKMIEETLQGGRVAKVRVQPRFVFTTKNEKEEYIKTPYENSIKGTVLKIRYMVDRKVREKDHVYKTPPFRSREFDSFQGKNVVLRTDGEISPAYTYKEFKGIYAEEYTLWTIAYFLMDTGTEEGKKVFKVKMKGVSRSNFWDYMKEFAQGDSITFHETEISFEVDDMGETPFNYMCFTKTSNPVDIQESLRYQRELKEALEAFNTRPATSGEVVGQNNNVVPANNQNISTTTTPKEVPAVGIVEDAPPIPGTIFAEKKEEEPTILEKAMGATGNPIEKAEENTDNNTSLNDRGRVSAIPF